MDYELTAELFKADPDFRKSLKKADKSLAQILFDSGLLYMVNESVLHRYGMALGIVEEDGIITSLSLMATDDPAGMWFDENTTEMGRKKLEKSGLIKNMSQWQKEEQ